MEDEWGCDEMDLLAELERQEALSMSDDDDGALLAAEDDIAVAVSVDAETASREDERSMCVHQASQPVASGGPLFAPGHDLFSLVSPQPSQPPVQTPSLHVGRSTTADPSCQPPAPPAHSQPPMPPPAHPPSPRHSLRHVDARAVRFAPSSSRRPLPGPISRLPPLSNDQKEALFRNPLALRLDALFPATSHSNSSSINKHNHGNNWVIDLRDSDTPLGQSFYSLVNSLPSNTTRSSIASITTRNTLASKVPCLLVYIHNVVFSHADMACTFSDQSGSIDGVVHKSVLDAITRHIDGAALLLHDVSVFQVTRAKKPCTYLNVTARNVKKVVLDDVVSNDHEDVTLTQFRSIHDAELGNDQDNNDDDDDDDENDGNDEVASSQLFPSSAPDMNAEESKSRNPIETTDIFHGKKLLDPASSTLCDNQSPDVTKVLLDASPRNNGLNDLFDDMDMDADEMARTLAQVAQVETYTRDLKNGSVAVDEDDVEAILLDGLEDVEFE